jgi:hypothetical protein
MVKYQNKYRIPSARAPWWDYANGGAYFITICTAHRIHYFGENQYNTQHELNCTDAIYQTQYIASLQIPTPIPQPK